MRIVSHETEVSVTFDQPLQNAGALDVQHYRFVGPPDAVPVMATAVAPIRAIVGSNVTSTMDGSSSMDGRLDLWSVMAGETEWSAQIERAVPLQAVMAGGSEFWEGGRAEAPLVSLGSIAGVVLTINKPTSGKLYRLDIEGLLTAAGEPYSASVEFTAWSSKPRVEAAVELHEGQLLVTFSEAMRLDEQLLSPQQYLVQGPTQVLVKTAQTASFNQVLLTTAGLSSGQYTLEVNASGSPPHCRAGNPLDPSFSRAVFTGSPPLAARSIFTDHGPISKPELIVQSGATASITSAVQISLPGASLNAALVGLYIRIDGTANAGGYRITSIVSPTVAKVAASFSLPDIANGSIGWEIVDPRDGEIADDPADVTVTINDAPVLPEAVIGLLGQVVLPTVPASDDVVVIDYSWIQNPVVDFRRLNSVEFRLNNWNRDIGRPTDSSGHKYRYNNTLIQPASFVALDIQAKLDQPQQRDLKYRAYERAYSVALNDPNLLLLNSPNHRIAFQPMMRALQSTFVNYQGTTLPEAAPVDPWLRHGVGEAEVSGTDLVVTDNTTGPSPDGNPIFWTRSIDLTFDHVFAVAWRLRVDAVATPDGVFTGLAAGYSDASTAAIVGFLDTAEGRKFGILKRGLANDSSQLVAWGGGVDSLGNGTGAAVDVDWSILRSYRIFRDRAGIVTVYVDGSIVPFLRALPEELPFLEELNAPFNELQGPCFGSLSREARNTSTWSFVRYTAIPINPLEAAPSVYLSYEATTPPESASQPWTPIGFHGTETIITGSHLLLDSTSATDLPSATAAGLISGDFKGYNRIEPLLSESFNTVLDINVALRTHTHGITPNALMAAIDDGDRLIQLSFLADRAYPKFSYGGRSLPEDFAPYAWASRGNQTAAMIGQYLEITDTTTNDGLVYWLEDLFAVGDSRRVVGHQNNYALEFRVKVEQYTPDLVGFCGVMSQAYDSLRAVGVQLIEVGGTRYLELHSDGVAIPTGGRFEFDWLGDFHTYRLTRATDVVSLFADGAFLGSVQYSSFEPSSPSSLTGMVSFGSSTPLSAQATSVAIWAYSNYWRFDDQARKFVGLWKGYDPNQLTGYHLPILVAGREAQVAGSVLSDPGADFVAANVVVGDQLVIDVGPNKGVYEVQAVASPTRLTFAAVFPHQPSTVDYRVVVETDWSQQHEYRIVKDPSGGVQVLLDAVTEPLIRADYSNTDLPPSAAGIPRAISSGLPSITWGAFDPTNLSQSSWDYVRLGAVRSISELGIVPHHQILNQRNIMASFEHHRTNIRHQHTNFWSESEGIPPQTEPDLLRDPNLVAFTLLNDSTPLVPSTQTYEVRRPQPVLVPVAALNGSDDTLNNPAFILNNSDQRVEIVVPDDVLYNSLEVIERTTGVTDVIAPFDAQMIDLGVLHFQKWVCLSYDGSVLPENDTSAASPWQRVSVDPGHQSATAFSGVLTYGTDSVGTQTLYRNPTPLPDAVGLRTEVKFRLKLVQDSSLGLGDSQVRVGFSSPGVTVGLAFVTTPLGERYVLAVDLNNGQTVGGIPFDFYDGAYHDYLLVRDPASALVQIFIDA